MFWTRSSIKLNYLGVYAKRWPKCALTLKQKLMYPKIWLMIFFLTFPVGRHFHRKDFKWKKKDGGTGLVSEKMEALHAELNERAEAATSTYSAVLVAKNY